MELTVVRGQATPEELEAIKTAVARCLARKAGAQAARWADPARSLRGPLAAGGEWRLSGWTG
ncbi:acyl-CoA carboxylase subunit epsilon [Nonomuraea sp. NPDC049400]|uniref:acyl-CoA carboxylase subunit epsilon n=1 Tax=Nonomuraea sp. NPDC049400 TaxID=3364352 RepID=UPI00378AB7BD